MSLISDTLDGAQGICGLKQDVTLDNWAKRFGAALPVIAATKIVNDKFIVGPAIKKHTNDQQYTAIKRDVVGGGFSLPA